MSSQEVEDMEVILGQGALQDLRERVLEALQVRGLGSAGTIGI